MDSCLCRSNQCRVVQRVQLEYQIPLQRESLSNSIILLDRASHAQVSFLHDNFYPFDNNFTGVACRSRRHPRKVDKGGPTPVCTSLFSHRFEHAKRFYCLDRKSLVPSLNSGKTAVTTSCSSVHVEISGGPKGDWTLVLHILGQILAHNSILHATAGSKFLRVQVASFSITLHRMRQLCAFTTGHDHRQLQAAGC